MATIGGSILTVIISQKYGYVIHKREVREEMILILTDDFRFFISFLLSSSFRSLLPVNMCCLPPTSRVSYCIAACKILSNTVPVYESSWDGFAYSLLCPSELRSVVSCSSNNHKRPFGDVNDEYVDCEQKKRIL